MARNTKLIKPGLKITLNKGFTRQKWIAELFDLIFKSYRRSFPAIFFTFVQPVIIFAIFYFVFIGIKGLHQSVSNIAPGYLLIGTVSASLIGFANMLSIWKDSILLKRLDVTVITKTKFMSVLIAFYSLIAIIAMLWMMMWTAIFASILQGHLLTGFDQATHKPIFKSENFHGIFNKLNWGWLFLAIIQLILICNTLAVLVCGLVVGQNKTASIVQTIFFPAGFIGGAMLPMVKIDSIVALKWISYFMPLKFPAFLSNLAWNNGDIKTISYANPGSPYVFTDTFPHVWIPIVVGFALPVIFLAIAIKTFKWNR